MTGCLYRKKFIQKKKKYKIYKYYIRPKRVSLFKYIQLCHRYVYGALVE